MNLSVPLPKGYRENTVYAIIRHRKAYHNATKDELINLWIDVLTTDQQNEYAQKAMDRFTTKGHTQEEWKALPFGEQVALSIKEMRYDAPLTEEGRNEARQASGQLRTYINATYPGAVVNVYTSPLYRAYETASFLINGWIDNDCAFSFTPTVNANFRELIEINRAMQSANHALGTPERAIAESSKRTMDEYVLTILKNPPTKDIWATMSPTERQPFYDSVDDVLAENVPLLVKKRPSTLNGVPICHKGSGKVYAEVDLFSVLSAIVA